MFTPGGQAARASRALRRSTCCRPRAACADRSGGPQEPRRGPQRPVKTPSQGNSGRREVTGTRRVAGEDGGVVECAKVAFTAPSLMVADVTAAVLHFAVARGSPGAQKAQIWRPFASPQKQAKPAPTHNWADIACRALVELSPSVTKLQCPVRQVSARPLQLGPVGAHPRSDQGIGGLQSDARSHSPASITGYTATRPTALTIP